MYEISGFVTGKSGTDKYGPFFFSYFSTPDILKGRRIN